MGQCQTKNEVSTSTVEWNQRVVKGGTFLRSGPSRSPTLLNIRNTFKRNTVMRSSVTRNLQSRTSIYNFKHTKNKSQAPVVMSTPSCVSRPWEARLQPGTYNLSDLVNFPDIQSPEPRYAKFTLDNDSWKSTVGHLEIPLEVLIRQEIPVEIATDTLLKFYGCSLIGEGTGGQIKLGDEHIIQDFTYQQDYFKKYVQDNVGAGIERHEFAHIDCPLVSLDESGLFLLGKMEEEESIDNQPAKNNLYLIAFRIPHLNALFVPGGTIHSNDYLQGCWRTMLSWTSEEPIDGVKIFGVSKGGQQQKGVFRIQGMDSTDE